MPRWNVWRKLTAAVTGLVLTGAVVRLVAEVLDRFQDGDGSHGDDLLGEPGPLALLVEDGQT